MAGISFLLYFLVYVFTIQHFASGDLRTKSVLTCEKKTAHLKCDGSKVINVQSVFWGRRHDDICGGRSRSTRCNIDSAAKKLENFCNFKKECSILASKHNFGWSWWKCGRTTYYLQASYTCIGGEVQLTTLVQPTDGPTIFGTKTKTLCQDKNSFITCSSGEAIYITNAFFGRKDSRTCNENKRYGLNTKCQINVMNKLNYCNNQMSCHLSATTREFGNPCPGTPKYLEIQYRCIPSVIHTTSRVVRTTQPTKNVRAICEYKTAIASCPNGQIINIKYAFFGRQNSITCPGGTTWNTNCYTDVMNVVKYQCHHQQQCILSSDAGVFGDPCPGVSKYLEFDYNCIPRGNIPLPTDMVIPPIPLATRSPGGDTGYRQCGVSNMQTSRIINGRNAKQGEFPWQAAIYRDQSLICGGSVISPNWILTAAHCFQDLNTHKYLVILGDLNRRHYERVERKHEVKRIIRHRNFDRGVQHDHDIALIELWQPAYFDNHVSPICSPDDDYKVGEQCIISGWGQIKYPGPLNDVLQKAELPIISSYDCERKLRNAPGKPGDRITNNMFCVGRSNGASGCHGDSGGPLVCRKGYQGWQLRGIVSWGSPRCNTNDMYTVLTNVHNYKQWINNYVKW